MPEMEPTLERALGRVEAGVTWLSARLEAHTIQDDVNFKLLLEKLEALDAKLTPVHTRVEAVRVARNWAMGAGAGVAGFVTLVAQVAQALGWLG